MQGTRGLIGGPQLWHYFSRKKLSIMAFTYIRASDMIMYMWICHIYLYCHRHGLEIQNDEQTSLQVTSAMTQRNNEVCHVSSQLHITKPFHGNVNGCVSREVLYKVSGIYGAVNQGPYRLRRKLLMAHVFIHTSSSHGGGTGRNGRVAIQPKI